MTGIQLALASGALLGLGVALAIWAAVPAHPDLADALDRLTPPTRRPAAAAAIGAGPTRQERLGLWARQRLPRTVWLRTPAADLAILRKSDAQFFGEKVLYAVLGLAIPPALTGFFALLGLTLPALVPAGATLGLGVGMFFLPDYNARDDAKKARAEFTRALSAYIDLVALERNSGSGARQAMENAAAVGDSWVFRRIGEELARSRYGGHGPWDGLAGLGDELALPDLADLGDIMRIAGDEDAKVYTQLRARAASMRSAMLSAELTQANVVEERMYIPASFLGVVFLALLIAPSILRLLTGTP
jgi:hypothetical protein